MSDTVRGQVTPEAAEVYDDFFVRAYFGECAEKLVAAAELREGQRVLDVACGTGVVSRTAAAQVGPSGSVVGYDLNDGMLEVARRVAPKIEWRQGPAEKLPFEDASFDRVLCQFALMFFEDGPRAVAEMARVLRPGGRLVIAVGDSIDTAPSYVALTGLLDRLFGQVAGDAYRAPFLLGDRALLASIFRDAGIPDIEVQVAPVTSRYPSIEQWLYTDARGWTLAALIDDAGYERLLAEAKVALAEFVKEDGTVASPAPALFVHYTKPSKG